MKSDTIPRILYRYLDWNSKYGPKLLMHHHLYFAKASTLNDPYDCAMHIAYDEMSDTNLRRTMQSHLKIRAPHLSKTERESELVRGFEHVGSKTYRQDQDADKREMVDERFGVCCTSQHWDSVLMWAYYSASHSGFCVGLDRDVLERMFSKNFSGPLHAWPERVRYTTKATLNPRSFRRDLLPVRLLTTKSTAWKHEDEIRLILMGDKTNLTLTDRQRIVSVPANAIAEVLLGWKISEDDRQDIEKLLKRFAPHVKLYGIEPEIGHFRLVKRRIDY